MKKSSAWKVLLFIVLVAGACLRLAYVQDMEYKEDEQIDFHYSRLVGNETWPWVGMPSGVSIANPGMSVWVFEAMGKIFHVKEPTELDHADELFNILGILLLIPFALFFVKPEEKETWLWAFALALVNPFAIYYQRKLWPEPFLPFFSMLMLMGWWKRETRLGAFFWGLIGAILGQVHMSGFFVAGGLFLWTALFKRKNARWFSWFIGSCLGALPLLPWADYVLKNPVQGTVVTGLNEIVQLKYWVFWITDPTGLHLGNPLGLLHGNSTFAQLSDFIRYPILSGHPTYLVGLVHLVTVAIVARILMGGVFSIWKKRSGAFHLLMGRSSDTAFVQNAFFWGAGILMTVTGVVIRRYYMMATFPLEFVWLTRAAGTVRNPRKLLAGLCLMEFLISAAFVGYVHVNDGAPQGDYGVAYHVTKNRDAKKNSP